MAPNIFAFENSVGLTERARAIADISKLLALAEDLRQASEGHGPDAGRLASAPVIDEWVFAMRPVPILVGRVSGHPDFARALENHTTSELWIDASSCGWVRTFSRVYRLGREGDPKSLLARATQGRYP